MSSTTTFAESPNHPTTSNTARLQANESQNARRRARNAIVIGLAFEVLFLGIVAAYVLSSILRYQNCL